MSCLKKRLYLLAALIVISAAFLFVPVASVVGQASNSITEVTPNPGIAGTQLSISVQGTIATSNGYYVVLLNGANVTQGNATGNSVNANFTIYNVPLGYINLALKDNSTGLESVPFSYHVAAEGLAAIPIATGLIMLIAIAISFANVSLNRLIITKMIGWHEYRTMQKEIAEHNAERMAALRAKDTKAIERLKKKDSQVNAMQAKMLKPQMLQFPLMFIYFFIWPFLTGFFPFTVAYIPGLGAQPFFAWYMICSFFFGTLASRIIGVTPIQ